MDPQTLVEMQDEFDASAAPKARIDRHDDGFTVWAVWPNVDRPETHGIATGDDEDLALRLALAVERGLVYETPSMRTDIYGHTYIEARCRVLGRRLKADLRRLGA